MYGDTISTDTSEHSSKLEVLFIDDIADVCMLAKKFLEDTNKMHVSTTADTITARKILKEYNIDIIVCDNHMPEETGLEFLHALRKEGDKIPFILITGEGNVETVVEAFKGGADFYITKSGNANMYKELSVLIEQAIYKRSVEKALEDKNAELRNILEEMIAAQEGITMHLHRIRCGQLT